MPTIEQQYEKLVEEAKADSGVIGFVLGGGRGKNIQTEHSDYDITLVVEDAVLDGAKVKYQAYAGGKFDITILTERDLMIHGVWGSDTMWARYGFAHVKAIIDKNNRIQRWLDEQETVPAPAVDDAIKQSLDGYLNYTHRSLKNFRDFRNTAAHLAACDAVPLLISFLFTAEYRIRPYNEYIEWELTNHPLRNLKFTPEEFSKKISQILANGDEAVQKEMLAIVRTIAAQTRMGQSVLTSWEGYYFGE